ncbi:progestin and adipoQ receptor family member 4-like [Tigriopus californicus]|uniref:progestin and adipoQ receptor family member 4-like n=1 Tax=Tigriopus californicus TaxID=6832 RepID=UPI0027D9E677|nr:progestin and adipoQ receptor family member 4-like [Tigriopus californicus]
MSVEKPRFLKFRHEVPAHLRFNKYVLYYYRPITDWWGCLASLLYIHNETVNILTHALPPFIIFYYLPTMLPWDQLDTIPILPYLHVISCLSPWIGSTLYHLFMSHNSGLTTYKQLLAMDMFGIWVAQNCGTLPCVTAATYCFPPAWRYFTLMTFVIGSFFSCYKAVTAKSPWQRRFSFLFPFLFRLIIVILRVSKIARGSPKAMPHLLLQDVVAVVGGALGAWNIPERWYPGQFDLCLNSHNIMHVLVVYAAYEMHQAVSYDLLWISALNHGTQHC